MMKDGPGLNASMDWHMASVWLRGHACPTVAVLKAGERVECLGTGGASGGSPCSFVYAEDSVPQGWSVVAPCSRGALLRNAGAACERCPFAALPAGVERLRLEASDRGIRFDALFQDRRLVASLLAKLAAEGHEPEILRAGPVRNPLAGPKVVLGLDSLTPRQLEALRVASVVGYFREASEATLARVAEEMGCSRSTAHEHLHKGLDRLLTASFPALETSAATHRPRIAKEIAHAA